MWDRMSTRNAFLLQIGGLLRGWQTPVFVKVAAVFGYRSGGGEGWPAGDQRAALRKSAEGGLSERRPFGPSLHPRSTCRPADPGQSALGPGRPAKPGAARPPSRPALQSQAMTFFDPADYLERDPEQARDATEARRLSRRAGQRARLCEAMTQAVAERGAGDARPWAELVEELVEVGLWPMRGTAFEAEREADVEGETEGEESLSAVERRRRAEQRQRARRAHRERIVEAMTETVGEKGYRAASLKEVLGRARCSSRSPRRPPPLAWRRSRRGRPESAARSATKRRWAGSHG